MCEHNRLKTAKAGFEEAKTRKLHSDADVVDLNFLKADQGIGHQEAMDKEMVKQQDSELSRQHELNKLMLEQSLNSNTQQV